MHPLLTVGATNIMLIAGASLVSRSAGIDDTLDAALERLRAMNTRAAQNTAMWGADWRVRCCLA